LERKNAGNRSRNSCVLGARASGPHLNGWNRGALVAVPVLRRTPGGPHLPPSPLPLPRWGRGRGRALPPLPAGPFRSPTGRGRGRRCIPFPLAPLQLLHGGGRERTPEIAHAMVACWEGGPLARILMEQGGTGCSAGAGSARLAALTFPPAPFRSPAGGEEGGGWGLKRKNAGNCSRDGCVLGARASGPHLDGTGGHRLQRRCWEHTLGGPHLPPSPLPLPRWGRGRGRRCLTFPPAPSPLHSSPGVLVPAPVGAGFQPARWAAGREGI